MLKSYKNKIKTESQENTIAVHCLAEKGRTKFMVCCFLIFSRRFQNIEEVLKYYEKIV